MQGGGRGHVTRRLRRPQYALHAPCARVTHRLAGAVGADDECQRLVKLNHVAVVRAEASDALDEHLIGSTCRCGVVACWCAGAGAGSSGGRCGRHQQHQEQRQALRDRTAWHATQAPAAVLCCTALRRARRALALQRVLEGHKLAAAPSLWCTWCSHRSLLHQPAQHSRWKAPAAGACVPAAPPRAVASHYWSACEAPDAGGEPPCGRDGAAKSGHCRVCCRWQQSAQGVAQLAPGDQVND